MNTVGRTLILLFLLTASMAAYPADIVYKFKDDTQEQRYQGLINELRCLVCQNQSLADSHAELAQDLRNEVYEKIIQGDTDETIIEFLVNRYGDFVLYRPPVKQTTWILWFGPFLILFIAIMVAFRIITTRKKAATEPRTLQGDGTGKGDALPGKASATGEEEK